MDPRTLGSWRVRLGVTQPPAFPGADGVRIKADSPSNAKVGYPPSLDEEVETVAMDAEPKGKLTRVP